MAEIPRAVLSEQFQQVMEGRVLKTGVFLTFRFDPGFFEQEVLPVFLDAPLSHDPNVRLIQLEDAIRDEVDHLAVYYDPGAIEPQEASAKLDVRRIPVRWSTGYFHPKNVLLLVEDAKDNEDGLREQRLLVGTLSANLTRAGWWENVEVCHVEEIAEGEKSSLRADLLKLVSRIRSASPREEEHLALEAIRRFVLRVDDRKHKTAGGVLHPRLYTGTADDSDAREGVPDFLKKRLLPTDLSLNLEVISPYFDDTADAGPLVKLIERFQPREVRVFLPRGPDGKALCKGAYYDAVRKLEGTAWGKLPADLLKSGPAEGAAPRTVHAKVYRFFCARPMFEALFVGSVNLTNAAHKEGGNFETGVLIQPELKRAPDWWLSVDGSRPKEFIEEGESESPGQGPGRALTLRYSWDTGEGATLWAGSGRSPALRIEAQGSPLFDLTGLPPDAWKPLAPEQAEELARVLGSTSLLTVKIEGAEDATILVQEEGMAHKPSILLTLSVADILRCWASLTPEQKAVLLEERYLELAGATSGLLAPGPLGPAPTSGIFEAFAGIFHAFGSLERDVRKALTDKRDKEAVYRLFGKKYDSLPRLLDRVLTEEKDSDPVNRYVMLLCARQLLKQVEQAFPEFRTQHGAEFHDVEARLGASDQVRASLSFASPQERDEFLDWFEAWFLRRAEPMVGEA